MQPDNIKDEIIQRIHTDKTRNTSLRSKARQQSKQVRTVSFVQDITGAPRHTDLNDSMKRRSSLESIARDGLFCSVETMITNPDATTETTAYLITKARGASGDLHSDEEQWTMLNWTSPLSTKLRNTEAGSQTFHEARNRRTLFDVISKCTYKGAVAPVAHNIEYGREGATLHISSENELLPTQSSNDTIAPLAEDPEPQFAVDDGRAFEADSLFGLHEIIAEADAHQRFVMHLPFEDHVLIEGPPGSGKTSLALMRIPCLLDGQWEYFNLDQEVDLPVYTEESTLILVTTEQMVRYLKTLRDSLNLRVQCLTFSALYRRLCREAGTLSGKHAPSSRVLRRLKGDPRVLSAALNGFQVHAKTLWSRDRDRWVSELLDSGGERTEQAISIVDRWVNRICDQPHSFQSSNSPSIGRSLTAWIVREKARRLDAIDSGKSDLGLKPLADTLRRLTRAFANRAGWTAHMFLTDTFEHLEQEWRREIGEATTDAAIDQWEEMAVSSQARFDDADLAISGWLALNFFASDESPELQIGPARPAYRHLVIDEAQDLTHAHAATLPLLLDKQGTLTVAGDLRQVLHDGGGLKDWSAFSDLGAHKEVFNINYRQSHALGTFVQGLYTELYDEAPDWCPNENRSGPNVRVLHELINRNFAATIAEEIRRARESIPNATVAVIFDGPVKKDRLRRLKLRLERQLEDLMLDVHLTGTREERHQIDKTDCVHILPVAQTKGLEFPVVVLADLYDRFGLNIAQMEPTRRNRLYVAASRSQQWLSIILRSQPQLQTLRARIC